MAGVPGTQRGHRGAASTTRTIYLPARRSWRERQRIDERLIEGEVIVTVNDDGGAVLTYMAPETEGQRGDLLGQLQAHIDAGPDPLMVEALATELEHVRSCELVVVPDV